MHFIEGTVALLGKICDKYLVGVNTCLWSELEYKQWSGQVCSENVKAKCIACELSVRSVATFCMVLYRNQRPVNFIFHFSFCIRYKNNLFGNYFLKCNIVKRNSISFNNFCFSE